MYPEPITMITTLSGLLADFDDGIEMMVGDHLRSLLQDEASIRKLKEPVLGNGRFRCDPTTRHPLLELAWYYDPTRTEAPPCWDRLALEKMRKPLVGFSHYRVTATTLPMLFELAWFHDGLLDGGFE
jgi:hypothetical protein